MYVQEGILTGYVNNISNYKVYQLDSNQIHFVKLNKIDTVNKIIAGEFEFMAVNGKKDTIRITKGRFDSKYN